MPSQHRKHRGMRTQADVAEYLQANGWPFAESAGAGRSGSDVTGVPFDVEVKARRGLNIHALLAQLEARAAEGRLGFGVLRLDGQGPASIDRWPVVLTLADMVALLKAAGYGAPEATP